MTRTLIRLELGKLPGQFVTLPRFLFSICRVGFRYAPVLIVGRLYRGYVGAIWIIPYLFELTLWIYCPDKELREAAR